MYKIILAYLTSFLGTLFVLYPINPINSTLPSRDAGVFLYIGWRWLNGDIPYKDVWDHKPPLIYVVDALGLSFTPNSLWGVWFLQFVFLFMTIFLVYKTLENQFGILSAVTGAVMMTAGLSTLLETGNVTEEYALVFQALCLYLFVKAYQADFPARTTFWLGLCAGLAFNSKQTSIGVWLTFALILGIVRIRQRQIPFRDAFAFLGGFLIPSLIAVLYFASQNALTDFWEQAYLYNFSYINKHEGWRSLIPVFAKGFSLLTPGGLLYLTGIAWLFGFIYVFQRRADSNPILWFVLLGTPIEAVLILTSGRSIIHYYLALLPVASVLIGSLAYTMPELASALKPFNGQQQRISLAVLLIVVILQYGLVQNYGTYIDEVAYNPQAELIDYIRQNTSESDTVWIIGAEAAVNFMARREAPTRYVYQFPLQLLGRRPMFEEYFNQILENNPKLIIDTRGENSLTDNLYVPLQKRSEIVRNGVQYLGENYEQAAQFDEWIVYQIK